jgi:hypothetical protein|tara:strand:- start:7130 stop:8332 length:1203 start_codon:yes stop_codon:yes gene_type:complete
MSTFTTITSDDIKTTTSVLNQLVDFVEEDISGSNTRKKFQVFVTSSATNAVTSSLFHTVYDQNFALQTANELFDMTVGLFESSATVTGSQGSVTQDSNGKLLFPSQSLMMREKINIYKQHAQLLLGNADSRFTAPFTQETVTANNNVDEALFINFKRLFVRDGIKRETFAIKMFQSSSNGHATDAHPKNITISTVNTASGSAIFTDVGSSTSIERSSTGGDVGNIVNASNTNETVGLMFYQQGIAVFDMKKVFHGSQIMTGSVKSVGAKSTTPVSGAFIPHFVVSSSIDDIVDHIAETRFGNGSNTTITFQNNTKINSTLYFCRATADEYNYSSNPSYTDAQGRIRVIGTGQEGLDKSFAFVTTVGLYDANEELLAVAKLSRPVEKNDEKDMTFRVRLDF